MHHELFPLRVIGGGLLIAAALVWVFVPSQRPTIGWRTMRRILKREWFWRRAALYVLCAMATAFLFQGPQLWNDRPVDQAAVTRVLHGTLIDAWADPHPEFSRVISSRAGREDELGRETT